ncbi:hypothetical protein RHEC894_PC00107 (plasmid) [Rhizobium sp. CIAT894]|nr:hypothetical protein RHEC894_PC00107 [Rhizobium sp. CIAT894]
MPDRINRHLHTHRFTSSLIVAFADWLARAITYSFIHQVTEALIRSFPLSPKRPSA